MSKRTALAGVARFAHLLGITPRAEAPEDENEDGSPKQGADESDEDFAQRCEEYEEEKKAKGKKAKAEEDEPDDKPKKGDEDPDAEDEDDDASAKAARKAERARCAAIFGSKAAASRPDMAAHLAFETGMSASAAIHMLGAIAAGQPKGSTLASRMSNVQLPVVGQEEQRSSGSPNAQSAAAASAKAIIDAGARARGEKV